LGRVASLGWAALLATNPGGQASRGYPQTPIRGFRRGILISLCGEGAKFLDQGDTSRAGMGPSNVRGLGEGGAKPHNVQSTLQGLAVPALDPWEVLRHATESPHPTTQMRGNLVSFLPKPHENWAPVPGILLTPGFPRYYRTCLRVALTRSGACSEVWDGR